MKASSKKKNFEMNQDAFLRKSSILKSETSNEYIKKADFIRETLAGLGIDFDFPDYSQADYWNKRYSMQRNEVYEW